MLFRSVNHSKGPIGKHGAGFLQSVQKDAAVVVIDLFTDTATILKYLDLKSIMGCSGGMSTIRYTR